MGLMSFVWMGILTVGIFLEKTARYGSTPSKAIGGIVILLGVGILLHPGLRRHLTA